MYVVVGATGQTGGVVARELVKAGKRVIGLTSRDPATVEGVQGVEFRQIDLRDADALVALARESTGFYGMVPPLWAPADYEAAVGPPRAGGAPPPPAAPPGGVRLSERPPPPTRARP
ncbi:MAG: NAD-dependent epimerase/dehydratase family protein, partial [Myxococcota bacterium]